MKQPPPPKKKNVYLSKLGKQPFKTQKIQKGFQRNSNGDNELLIVPFFFSFCTMYTSGLVDVQCLTLPQAGQFLRGGLKLGEKVWALSGALTWTVIFSPDMLSRVYRPLVLCQHPCDPLSTSGIDNGWMDLQPFTPMVNVESPTNLIPAYRSLDFKPDTEQPLTNLGFEPLPDPGHENTDTV